MKITNRLVVVIALVILSQGGSGLLARPEGSDLVALGDAHAVAARFEGPPTLAAALEGRTALPLSLTSADFDEDGVPDLACGFGHGAKGIVTVHRGNGDAIYPNAPEAKQRKADGTFVDAPFYPDARAFETPEPADFIGAGDFDADGHWDVVTAREGGLSLWFHRNDGKGAFQPAEEIALPGVVTAMETGEVNRRDGLTDIVVGVETPEGPQALIFEWPEGALRGEPEVLELAGPAADIAIGQMDNSYPMDIAIAAGDYVMRVTGRDRKLSFEESRRLEVPHPKTERMDFHVPVQSVELGDFDGDRIPDLAILTAEGRVSLLRWPEAPGSGEYVQAGTGRIGDEIFPGGKLLRTRSTGAESDDLIVLDTSEKRMVLLSAMLSPSYRREKFEPRIAVSLSDIRPMMLPVSQPPVSVWKARLNGDALDDLILLSENGTLIVGSTAALTTLTVTNINDSGAGSLREAILAANAAAGADLIQFNIPGAGPHVINLLSPLPTITGTVTIDGTTEPDFAGTPVVQIDGNAIAGTAQGLSVVAGNSHIRGLSINGFNGAAMRFTRADNCLVEGNFVGVDTSGVAANSNVIGIVALGTNSCVIGGTSSSSRNVVSGNEVAEIIVESITVSCAIDTLSQGNIVQGNYVGTDVTGTVLLSAPPVGALDPTGIRIDGLNNIVGGTSPGARNVVVSSNQVIETGFCEVQGLLIQGNYLGTNMSGSAVLGSHGVGVLDTGLGTTIGGTSSAARNVISGAFGSFLGGNVTLEYATNTLVQGNYIGSDTMGTSALGGSSGVNVFLTDSALIGGVVSGAGNVIGAHDGNGILVERLTAGDSINTIIQGNRIGVGATGGPLGNAGSGVRMSGTGGHTVGGATSGARNIISSNMVGVSIGFSSGADGNEVKGNYIGTDPAGTSALPGQVTGLLIYSHATGNLIGGILPEEANVISGNSDYGVRIFFSSATGNILTKNIIGLDATGSVAIPNSIGVFVDGAAGNHIGGSDVGNIISGNSLDGVRIEGAGATGNSVQGNVIGTNSLGASGLGNGGDGVSLVDAPSSLIGGSGPGMGNLISGNSRSGVLVMGSGAIQNDLKGNFIGITSSGLGALPNSIGVSIVGSSDNTVGGPGGTDRNVISANGNNLVIIVDVAVPANNLVEGNYFGTDATGTMPLGAGASNVTFLGAESTIFLGNVVGGNHTRGLRLFGSMGSIVQGNMFGAGPGMAPIGLSGPGILIEGTSSDNVIGGVNPGEGNVLMNNADDGIQRIGTGTGNAIRGNSIDLNSGLGIDLDPDGVTPNDAEAGPNNLQNFPVLTAAAATGGSVMVSGSLDSYGPALFDIDFFAGPACDASGHGEGVTYLGSTNVITDGAGHASFMLELLGPVSGGEAITATATGSLGNTSEFSACVTGVGVPPSAIMDAGFGSIFPRAISWPASPGTSTYHVYTGSSSLTPGLAGPGADSCELGSTNSTFFPIPYSMAPPPGEMIWYLVLPENLYGFAEPSEGASGPREQDSVGACGASCAHDKWVTGSPLEQACDPCVAMICEEDPSCCATSWDSGCQQAAFSVCGSVSIPGGGKCGQSMCETGGPLAPGCDEPPVTPSCVDRICSVLPGCCSSSWSQSCVDAITYVCDLTCL